MNWKQKIIPPEKIKKQLFNLKKNKLVFTNGCFDILHYGHLCYLNEAKRLGDNLMVALNSDESMQKIKNRKPYMILEHRLAILAALEFVDYVTWFTTETPQKLLEEIQPHVLAKGGDYSIKQVVGKKIVRSYGGEVFVLSHQKDISSSLLFQKIE